ncbi:MAG: ribbon-helix-helix domain-containing protein [Planctomycetes bacterium]|nr:ribbon-helix-helix domain-containing protein [Planctomycetota bacterium]
MLLVRAASPKAGTVVLDEEEPERGGSSPLVAAHRARAGGVVLTSLWHAPTFPLVRRTQITIDEETYAGIRERAHREGRSIAAVVRDLLRRALGNGLGRSPRRVRWTSTGAGRSGHGRLSEEHDEALGSADD